MQMKYRVVREHVGDKPYAEGDERIADSGTVSHLVPHVLEEIGPVRKKAQKAAPNNKAEGPSPANKGEGAATTK